MTKINDTVSLLSGGITNTDSYSAKTWYYNHDTETFTSGPDLLKGRRLHGSALNVDKDTKVKIVVVTGGLNSGNLDSTEMLINGQWQTGTIQCREQKYFDFPLVLYLSNMKAMLFHLFFFLFFAYISTTITKSTLLFFYVGNEWRHLCHCRA